MATFTKILSILTNLNIANKKEVISGIWSIQGLSFGSSYAGDANDAGRYAAAGLSVFNFVSGSTNFPAASGSGFCSVRTGGSLVGYFEFVKANANSDLMYFRTGLTSSTYSAWKTIASNESPSFTGNTKLVTIEYSDNAAALLGGLTVGMIYRTGDLLKIVH